MSNGFEEARRQRNWLERLGERIPGFRGFQDRELRREVDKLQREYLAEQITLLKRRARQRAQSYTDAGRIGDLDRFERLDRRLEGLSQTIRFSDYGATGLFDVEKIGDRELESIYRLDLSLVGDLDAIGASIDALPRPGAEDPVEAVDTILDRVEDLERKWSGRETIFNDIVETAG